MSRLPLPCLSILALTATAPSAAHDVTDTLSIGGIAATSTQCQSVSGAPDADSLCRGAAVVQPMLSYRLGARDELFLKLGLAAGNGLNQVSPWVLAPWAADLDDNVKDINGSGRSYLLTAWYRHGFAVNDTAAVATTFGLLDSTDYLDQNAYANDEYTQFMNEALTNAGTYQLPSYAPGAAIEAEIGSWSFNGVGMYIAENDKGKAYTFWGSQVGYLVQTAFGEGHYRANLVGTSSAFSKPEGNAQARRLAWGVSFDQDLGDLLGVFLRLCWQRQQAAVTYKALYSGGINLSGQAWGRENDTIGVGYGYLSGANLDIARTEVVEAYYRLRLRDNFAVSGDIQYMKDADSPVDGTEDNPAGWIFGLRATLEF